MEGCSVVSDAGNVIAEALNLLIILCIPTVSCNSY